MDGASISFLNLIKGIKEKGIEVVVVFPDWNEEFVSQINDIGIRYYQTPLVFMARRNWVKLNWKGKSLDTLSLIKQLFFSSRNLLPIIKNEAPDIIHTNVGVIIEGLFCSKIMRIPHVWHLREYQDKDFGWRIIPSKSIFSKMLRKSYVIAITKNILNHFGLKESFKYRAIYNGILPKSSVYLDFPKVKYFLCASRISREKGHDAVIRSFAEFIKYKADYKLKILGFGDEAYISELKQLSKSLGCEDSVEFLGYTDDVTPYMRRARALVVASLNEGFGRMTAEAAFCGCAIIGRNTGGTKEIMDEIGGMPFNEDQELLDNMKKVSRMSDNEYLEMVELSQQKAVDKYSNENNVNQIYNFYMDILKSRNNAVVTKDVLS